MDTTDIDNEQFYVALFLSTIAGLSTVIGGFAFAGAITMALGIAASSMITVSIVDLFVGTAFEVGFAMALVATLSGAMFFKGCQNLLPKLLNNTSTSISEFISGHSQTGHTSTGRRLWRLALINALTLTAHNLPEGMAVVMSTISSQKLGIKMALALALHNVPEGLCISVPAYASGEHTKKTAILLTLFSGLSEPVGALLTLLIFQPMLTEDRIHFALSFVGGIMLCVAFTELLPEAVRMERHSFLAVGLIVGTFIMSASLVMLS